MSRSGPRMTTVDTSHGIGVDPMATTARDELVRVSGVRCAYPDGLVPVEGVDVSVGVGEVVSIAGPSGCGNSTL